MSYSKSNHFESPRHLELSPGMFNSPACPEEAGLKDKKKSERIGGSHAHHRYLGKRCTPDSDCASGVVLFVLFKHSPQYRSSPPPAFVNKSFIGT